MQIVHQKEPPPGFEYVPIGNPQLTAACKELSRDVDAMIFIVSVRFDASLTTGSSHLLVQDISSSAVTDLSQQMHRVGHHFRETIVEMARSNLNDDSGQAAAGNDGQPEAIPSSQTEYNAQVDAAIRDLFPRIPNTDRQTILDHSFSLRMVSRWPRMPAVNEVDRVCRMRKPNSE